MVHAGQRRCADRPWQRGGGRCLGDWLEKPDDAYRQAAATLEIDPPAVLTEIVERLRALAK
jgi:hypothetical protein